MTKFKAGQVWQCRDQCLIGTITTEHAEDSSFYVRVERHRDGEEDDWDQDLGRQNWVYSKGIDPHFGHGTDTGQAATFWGSGTKARKMDLMYLLYNPPETT